MLAKSIWMTTSLKWETKYAYGTRNLQKSLQTRSNILTSTLNLLYIAI